MTEYDAPLLYLAYDLLTGKYIGRLPLCGVQFGDQLLSAGQLTGTLDIASPAVQNLGPLSATAPARTAIMVDYNGALIWGGIIWPRNYDYDSTKRQLSITASGLWSYPASRYQATDYTGPPYSGITGPSTKMAIWDASNTDASGVYDPLLIAWQLLYDALWQVPQGNILGGMSIAANGLTTAASYLSSGTQTPEGYYLNVNYPYSSLQQLGSIVPMLAGNGYLQGFDYGVDVVYAGDGTGNVPVATVNLSYPRRGRTYAQNNLVLNTGQAIKYSAPEDGAQAGNTIYELGMSGSLVVSQNVQPLDGGYPVLEQLKSRSNIQSANVLQVLSALGAGDLAVQSYPVATPTVTTDLFNGPIPLGEFIVGDDCLWVIPEMTGGTGEMFDPRFPNGYSHEWRIIGYNATVADDGQSTLDINLALPPTTTVSGPALP